MQLERLLQRQGFRDPQVLPGVVRQGRVAWPGRPRTTLRRGGYRRSGVQCRRNRGRWQESATVILRQNPPATSARSVPSTIRRFSNSCPDRCGNGGAAGRTARRGHHRSPHRHRRRDLNHRLVARKSCLVYVATTADPLDAIQVERLLAGVVLNDDPEPVAAAGRNRRLTVCALR